MNPIYLAIYIGCSNDTNGNPRRGWYVSPLTPGNGISGGTRWVEEGYDGDTALYRAIATATPVVAPADDMWAWRDAARKLVRETGRIEVTPGEYRSARKLPRFGGAS